MGVITLENDNMKMRCFRFGTPEGQPFVILPGVALKSVIDLAAAIEAQYSVLAETYDVYVIDRRTDLPVSYSIAEMAEDTAAAMDMLAVENAVVYGVSQGGMIAQEIALRRPELVRKLILCSTASYIPEKAGSILSKWAELAEKYDIPGLMQAFAENVYSVEYCEKYRDAFTEYGRNVTDEELERFAVTVRGCCGFDVRDRLGGISSPTLVIGAGKDRIFGAGSSRETAQLTGGELFIYSDDAHSVYDENPDVTARIKEFADR